MVWVILICSFYWSVLQCNLNSPSVAVVTFSVRSHGWNQSRLKKKNSRKGTQTEKKIEQEGNNKRCCDWSFVENENQKINCRFRGNFGFISTDFIRSFYLLIMKLLTEIRCSMIYQLCSQNWGQDGWMTE